MTAPIRDDPRRTPTQRRSRETVDAILEATARLLAEDPAGAPSTNRIARLAGVSIGTLYQYFDRREAIVQALARRHAAEMQALLVGNVERLVTAPVHEVVPAFVEAIVAAHALAPRLHVALVRELLADGGALLAEVQDPAHALVLGWLEARRDELRPRDLPAAASLLTLTVEAAVHGQILFDPARLHDPRWRDELVDLLLRYLLEDPPRDRGTRHSGTANSR